VCGCIPPFCTHLFSRFLRRNVAMCIKKILKNAEIDKDHDNDKKHYGEKTVIMTEITVLTEKL
jgi:hypothetical protein